MQVMQGAANIIREFETQSALRPDAKTKLLHIPMSFHLRDRELMERDGSASAGGDEQGDDIPPRPLFPHWRVAAA